MALGGGVPPWLNVGPTDYLHAIQSGTQTGLAVAEAQNRAQEAAARRAIAQQQQAQAAWEFGERMRVAAEENARQDRYQTGMLDWRRQQLDEEARRNAASDLLRQGQFEETKRHNLATEGISADRAQNLLDRGEASIVEHPEVPGVKFLRNPSGAEAVIERPQRELSPSEKINYTLRGLNEMKLNASEDPNDPMYQARTNYAGNLLRDLGTLPQQGTKALDRATAAEFLRQSGGDKAKARQMAKDAGYTF